jgi:hypothetical protein
MNAPPLIIWREIYRTYSIDRYLTYEFLFRVPSLHYAVSNISELDTAYHNLSSLHEAASDLTVLYPQDS